MRTKRAMAVGGVCRRVFLRRAGHWGVGVWALGMGMGMGLGGHGSVNVGAAEVGAGTLKVGDPFPDLKDFGLEGDVPETLLGKVVLIDFWASWCGPCRGTFPLMQELHGRFSKQGLLILAINEDKSRVAMTEFLKDHQVSFTVLRDASRKLVSKVNVPALPTSYVLDRKGKVVLIQSGATTLSQSKEFIRRVQELLEAGEPTRGAG